MRASRLQPALSTSRPVAATRTLHLALLDFTAWLECHRDALWQSINAAEAAMVEG